MTTDASNLAHPETNDPWSDLDRLLDGWSRAYGGFPWTGFGARRNGLAVRFARTDVQDTGAAYQITAEVPGIPKERLDIRIRGSLVEIRGSQEKTAAGAEGTFLHQERANQGFYRAVDLPEPVKAAAATATVEHGLLSLELPKESPTPSPAEVQVKVQ